MLCCEECGCLGKGMEGRGYLYQQCLGCLALSTVLEYCMVEYGRISRPRGKGYGRVGCGAALEGDRR